MDQDILFSTAIAGANYQKIAFMDSDTVSVPDNTPNFQSVAIDHNLGYIPTARVWYDPALGYRFPLSLEQYVDSDSFESEVNFVIAKANLTTSQLILRFNNASGSTKNIKYWYRIYYDR